MYCPACGVASPTAISQETSEDRTVRQPDVDETAYCAWLQQALRVARDLGFLADEDWRTLDILRGDGGKLTWGLYRAVSNARDKKGSKTNSWRRPASGMRVPGQSPYRIPGT